MTMRQKLMLSAGMSGEDVVFKDGRLTQGNRSVTLASLAGPNGIEADGGIQPGSMTKMFSQQSYGAHFAEVGVDADTGEIRLRRMLGVFTAGRILNAKTARSQAIGGMVFGVGAALMEKVELDHPLRHVRQQQPRRVSCAGARRHHGDRCRVPARARRQVEPAEEQGDRRIGHLRGRGRGGERGLQRDRTSASATIR